MFFDIEKTIMALNKKRLKLRELDSDIAMLLNKRRKDSASAVAVAAVGIVVFPFNKKIGISIIASAATYWTSFYVARRLEESLNKRERSKIASEMSILNRKIVASTIKKDQ